MRICSPHCGIDPETTSGGETYERELLKRIDESGHAVDVMLARHKRHPEGVPNLTVHRMPLGRGLRWPVAAVLLPPLIKRLHDTVGFDLLRAHSLRYIGPAALIARRRYRLDVPIVAHHHHLDPSPLNAVIERRVMLRAERVVVGSEFAVDQAARELGVPAERFAIVYYGVDERFAPGPRPAALAARLGIGEAPVVLFLGGLKRRKNLFALLDVWREVAAARPDARLVVAGGGPLRAQLERYARDLGIAERIVFSGYIPEADKVGYYRLADVFLFPSTMEGFGLSVAEAMSTGVPVVASARGSLPELVEDGEGGILCAPDDRGGLATAVLRLLGDMALRRRFGAANHARVDRLFRWDRCAARTLAIYEDVLETWRRRARNTAATVRTP